MRMPGHRLALISSLLLLAGPAAAEWAEDGFVPDPTPEAQYRVTACPDGAGGMIIAYEDERDGTSHIYAQRVDAWGNALWDAGGLPICTAAGSAQSQAVAVADGAGGAYIAWRTFDLASGEQGVVAQHVEADGTASWLANGLAVTLGYVSIPAPVMTATDDGGAVAAWTADPGGVSNVYAAGFTPEGIAWSDVVSAEADQETEVQVAPLWGGRVALTWQRNFGGLDQDIYYYELDATGSPGAIVNPMSICGDPADQIVPRMVADGHGGVYVAWNDGRNGTWDIYMAQVSAYGEIQSDPGGTPICTEAGDQFAPVLAATGDGCFVCWSDARVTPSQIYFQRTDRRGMPQLVAGGLLLYSGRNVTDSPILVADGNGGAIAILPDHLYSFLGDLLAQDLRPDGSFAWPSPAVPVAVGDNHDIMPAAVGDGAGGVLVAWQRNWDMYADIAVQRIESNGYWGYPAPYLAAADDVPGDQGGAVIVSWEPSRLDTLPQPEIDRYTVWRALPMAKAAQVAPSGDWLARALSDEPLADGPVVRAEQQAARTFYWELVDVVEAYGLRGYSLTVPTWYDAVDGDPALHRFQVLAHGGAEVTPYWASGIVSGASVDNLAPPTPLNLAGEGKYAPQGLALTWSPVPAGDLHHYVVHRGGSADFVPDETTLVGAPADTALFDDGWAPGDGAYYKVAAVDVHENVGPYAALAPEMLTGVDEGRGATPGATALLGNHPNPFNPTTVIDFALAEPGPVRLLVFDPRGRLVRTLVSASLAAGRHEAIWDGRNDAGASVASGAYLCRLETAGLVQTGRMMLVR